METTEIGTYAMVALTIGLAVYIWKLRQRNIANSQDEPVIAGQDVLDGAAKNPEQFEKISECRKFTKDFPKKPAFQNY